VLNRSFINDASPTILAKSLQYVGGVQTGTITWSVDRYLIRGFIGEGDFVDGFITTTDKNASLNLIDHVEVIKGPAAIFVANQNNTVGGVINKISKSPTDYNQASLTLQVGQWDTNRADFDISGPITADKKLMYRLLVAGQDSKGYFDYQYEKRTSIIPMLGYNYSKDTQAWIKFETFDSHYSSYNGTPLDGRTNQPITIPRKANISGNNPNVWRTDWFNRLWGQVSTRPTDWLAIRLAGYHGKDTQRKVEATFSRRADTKQTVIDPASGTTQTVTVPGTIITSSPPGTSAVATNYPYPYTPGTLLFRDLTAVNGDVFTRDEIQNDYVFNFATGPVSHKLLVGGMMLKYPEKKKFYDSAGNNATVSALDPFNYASITSSANIVSVNFNQPPSQYAETENKFKKAYVLDTANLLKDRLIVNWGASRSGYEFSKTTTNYNQTTGVYAAPIINPTSKLFKNLVQWGILFKPIPNVSIFYGENRNFNNNGFAGTTPNPPGLGTQKELGAKTTWLDGRLGFNLTYFDAKSTNITVPAFPQGTVQNVFTAAVISRVSMATSRSPTTRTSISSDPSRSSMPNRFSLIRGT